MSEWRVIRSEAPETGILVRLSAVNRYLTARLP